MTKEQPLPGAAALQLYIDIHYEGSVNAFALEHDFNQSEISKFMRGVRQRMSVEMAARIAHATQGKVTMTMWIPM